MAEKTTKPEPKVEEVKPVEEVVQSRAEILADLYLQANAFLIDTPEAGTVVLAQQEGRGHYYRFADDSTSAKKARRELRKVLNTIWQSSATNYEEMGRKLRLSSLDLQGLIDTQFISKNPHLAN